MQQICQWRETLSASEVMVRVTCGQTCFHFHLLRVPAMECRPRGANLLAQPRELAMAERAFVALVARRPERVAFRHSVILSALLHQRQGNLSLLF